MIMDGEDKENQADNSQMSQDNASQDSAVSQEDVRAGYRTLIKDLVAAEDRILAAEAAGPEDGAGGDDAQQMGDDNNEGGDEGGGGGADDKNDALHDHMKQVSENGKRI